jgi:hypothetical protein
MIVIYEKFLVIKEINGYLVVMILINSFRSGPGSLGSPKTYLNEITKSATAMARLQPLWYPLHVQLTGSLSIRITFANLNHFLFFMRFDSAGLALILPKG